MITAHETQRAAAARNVALVACAALTAGCSQLDYITRQSIGMVGVLVRSVPIDDVLASRTRPGGGTLSGEDARKLSLIVEAREFARTRLGLAVRGSFQKFYDTRGKPMAFNLSAARKDSLSPKRWHFPVIGWIDYIGFYSRADAELAEQQLKDEGYDTYLREVDAFSSLGWLPDPVYSPLLNRDDYGLVEVVIHETAHNTVYANGQSDFNESLATFIGRTGAAMFFSERRPDQPDAAAELTARYEDEDRVNAWLIELRQMLDRHYGQDISSEEKIAGRDAVYAAARDLFKTAFFPLMHQPNRYKRWGDLAPNNALVRLNMRYNLRQDVFQRAFEAAGGDFAAFLDRLRAAALENDPLAALDPSRTPP